MLKRVLTIMITVMLVTMAVDFRPVNAQSVQDAVQAPVQDGVQAPVHDAVQGAGQDDSRAARMRVDVLKLGVSEKAQIEVKLRDSAKLKGYIGQAGKDSFTVVDSKNVYNQRILYGDVQKVKKAGSGFSARSWIIVGAAVAGALATWIIIKPALCDGGAQTRGPC